MARYSAASAVLLPRGPESAKPFCTRQVEADTDDLAFGVDAGCHSCRRERLKWLDSEALRPSESLQTLLRTACREGVDHLSRIVDPIRGRRPDAILGRGQKSPADSRGSQFLPRIEQLRERIQMRQRIQRLVLSDRFLDLTRPAERPERPFTTAVANSTSAWTASGWSTLRRRPACTASIR